MKKKNIDLPTHQQLQEYKNTPYYDDLTITPDMQGKVNELVKFFDQYGIDYSQFDEKDLEKINNKIGYPNYDMYMNIAPQRDTQKWLAAIKEIYYKEKNGMDRQNAIRQITSGWALPETYDFLNWIRFYEEGAHLKYKYAQNWYESGNTPGYFLHIKKDKEKNDVPISGNDIDAAKDDVANNMSVSERKHIIEQQRKKIIGRLDSAEKLLRTPDGQLFAGKELESLMETIYNLKKKIQLVNKVSSSTRLYEDMIIREANILTKNGFVRAANVLHSVAAIPAAAPPAPPAQSGGAPGGLPSMGPGTPQNPPDSAPNDNSPVPEGIAGFLENLDTGKITTDEDKNDVLEVEDQEDELMVSEAQALPPPIPEAPKVPLPAEPPATENPLEVKENELGDPKDADQAAPAAKNFDNIIDSAFANITVNDVVAKLEDLAKIFKNREIPRQLAIVDLMLSSLNLAAFFPSLSEATNKSLDSNNYISTRVEDILSKLRGSMSASNIDLTGENSVEKPEVAAIKNKLKTDEDKEKARKQQRKEQENMEMDSATPMKETPQVDIEEDLGAAPAPVAPPIPKAPIVPPENR